MFKFASIVVLLAAIPAISFAQTSCEQFSQAIEQSAKAISYAAVAGIGDNSAPRTTNRRLEQVAHASMINANLVLMQGMKCPLPKTAITESAYRDSASDCAIALAKAESGKGPVVTLPECDRATWKR